MTCVHFRTNLQGAVVSGCLSSSCPLLASSWSSGPARSPAGMAQTDPKASACDQLLGWEHQGINPDTADSAPGQARRPTVPFLSPPFLACFTGSE